MGVSEFHGFSNWLENLLSRHQYMINAVTAVSAVAVVVIAVRILSLLNRQTIARQRDSQIAGKGLFLANRDRLNDHLGYLSYCALLGRRPSKDSLETPENGLSLLLDALHDTDPGSSKRLKDHPQAIQFRPKSVILRSSEMQDLVAEMNDIITLADDCGCSNLVDRRIIELYSESNKNVPSIRGPGHNHA